jgi:membrane-bound ClpP family serine protease
VSFADSVVTPTGLYVIAAIRIVLGVVLVLAAAHSRLPRVLRLIGIVIIIAGALTPVFGVERSRAVLAWEASFGPMAMRLIGVVIVAMGGFLLYVVNPSRRVAV